MHAFFPPLGAYPNNAIVGASAGIATGAALFKKRRAEDAICVTYSGDGSVGCGPVWEAMNFASMAQFNTLWNTQKPGALPILFQFNNNFYAMGGQTIGVTRTRGVTYRCAARDSSAQVLASTHDAHTARPFATRCPIGNVGRCIAHSLPIDNVAPRLDTAFATRPAALWIT